MNALLLLLAAAPDAFPWSGSFTLRGGDVMLTWTVSRAEGQVLIEGTHSQWSVAHVAQADGTPVSTVKKNAQGQTARIVYRAGGADFTPAGSNQKLKVDEAGLWDADTLDARLAGIAWLTGKKVRFKVIDSDSKDGAVYAMVAEGLGLEPCGKKTCQVVKLTLDGWRRPFGPTVIFRFGVDERAPLLAYATEGQDLEAQ